MSLRSARPVDDSLSELAEQMALDEPSAARDNGETPEKVQSHTGIYASTYFKYYSLHADLMQITGVCVIYINMWI